MKVIDNNGERIGLPPTKETPTNPDQWYLDAIAEVKAIPYKARDKETLNVFRAHYMKAHPETYLDEPSIERARLVGLLAVAEAVLIWARTPQNHGGNPYCKEFVNLAAIALNKKDW